jgi:hypothetical protein
MTPHSPPTCPATEVKSASPPKRDPRQLALSRALLTSVATNNISTLQQGLAKMTTYWSGVAWVAGALTQRIQGIKAQDVDLVNVTETLGSYVSLPDAGSLPRNGDYDHREEGGRVDDAITPRTWDAFMHAAGGGSNGFGKFFETREVLADSQVIWTFRPCRLNWAPSREVCKMSQSKTSHSSLLERSGSDDVQVDISSGLSFFLRTCIPSSIV